MQQEKKLFNLLSCVRIYSQTQKIMHQIVENVFFFKK